MTSSSYVPAPSAAAGLTRWLPWVSAIALVWFSGSLLMDFLVMPALYTAGMTATEQFPSAGYTLFEGFNHVELLCAGLLLTGLLALRCPPKAMGTQISGSRCRWAVPLAVMLLAIALIYTYGLTPNLGGLGLSLKGLDPLGSLPAPMVWMQGLYWGLEGVKLLALGQLLALCSRDLLAQA